MSTPHYVAQKYGDHYVLVRQDLPANLSQSALLMAGLAVAVLGLFLGGKSRWLLFTVATGLAAMSMRGMSLQLTPADPVSRGRGFRRGPTFQHEHVGVKTSQQPQDAVDEAVMESFPASDPPSM